MRKYFNFIMGKIDAKFLVRREELSDFIEQNNIPTEEQISLFIATAMYFQDKGVVNGENYLWVYESRDGSELVLANADGKLARHMGEAMGFVGHKNDALDPKDERLRFHRYERIQIKYNERHLITYDQIYRYNRTLGERTSLLKLQPKHL